MARLSLLTFVALALSSIASGAPTPDGVNEEAKQNFQYCGGTGDIISVTTSPDTPDRGVQFSVTVVASTPAEIVQGSTINYSTSDGGAGTINICDVTSCPIPPGEYSLTFGVSTPTPKSGIPLKAVTISTKGYSPSKQELFCFNFTPIPQKCVDLHLPPDGGPVICPPP